MARTIGQTPNDSEDQQEQEIEKNKRVLPNVLGLFAHASPSDVALLQTGIYRCRDTWWVLHTLTVYLARL